MCGMLMLPRASARLAARCGLGAPRLFSTQALTINADEETSLHPCACSRVPAACAHAASGA